MRTLLFSLLCLFLLVGCKKDESNPQNSNTNTNNDTCFTQCKIVPMPVLFSNSFSPDEIDTVIVKKYTYGDNFTQLEADTTYTLADTIRYSDPGMLGFTELQLRGDYDYEIIIPATGHTFRISNITYPEKYLNHDCSHPRNCYVNANGYTVTGGEYQALQYSHIPMYLQLKK